MDTGLLRSTVIGLGTRFRSQPERLARLIDLLALAGLAVYLGYFLQLQWSGVRSPIMLEYDARAQLLSAFRYHGTGLLQDDLTVDFTAAEALPGWKAVYWVGTLFTDPFQVSKLLPFVLLAVLLWQGYALGRHFGRPVFGAAVALLLLHCVYLWNRLVGGNPRAFGYPLVVAFLRYSVCGHERRTLATLVLQAAFYPSALIFCGLAYAPTLLPWWRPAATPGSRRPGRRMDWKRVLRYLAAMAFAGGILLVEAHTDPRLGRVVTPADAKQIPEMSMMAAPIFKPLPEKGFEIAFTRYGNPTWRWLDEWNREHHHGVAWVVFACAVLVAGRRLSRLPQILFWMIPASLLACWLALLLLFRLYFPDRMLIYSLPPLALIGLSLVVLYACDVTRSRFASSLAALVLCAFQFGLYGDGLAANVSLAFYPQRFDPVVQWLATTPPDVLVAARLSRASIIQTFAQRRLLCSSQVNKSHFYQYSLWLIPRIKAFYQAYYATDLEAVRRLRTRFGVDLLVVDTKDFDPAVDKLVFPDMTYAALAKQLATKAAGHEVLAKPPMHAVVFHSGDTYVLDLRLLSPLPENGAGLPAASARLQQ